MIKETNTVAPYNLPMRFLIIEDNPDDAFLIIHTLKSSFPFGHFDVVSSRKELETQLVVFVDYDIILSDWSLPQFDGLAALAMVRRAGIDAPFLIVSGKIGEEAAIKAIREGVYDYILKDTLSRLPTAILHALSQHRQQKKEKIDNDLITLQATALQAAPVAIEILDFKGKVEWVNSAFQSLTGRTGTEVLGIEAIHLEDEDDEAWIKALYLDQSKQSDRIVQGIGRKKDGSIYLEERQICPVVDAKGNILHFVIIRNDITSLEQEKKELALDILFSDLEKDEKNLYNLCTKAIALLEEFMPDWKLGLGLYTDGTVHIEKWFGQLSKADCEAGATYHHSSNKAHYKNGISLENEHIATVCILYNPLSVLNQEKLVRRFMAKFESRVKELITQAKIRSQINNISFLKFISRTLNTYMDFDTVVGSLLKQIRTILDCDAVSLFLVEKDDQSIVCKSHSGFKTNLIERGRVRYGDSFVGIAAEERRIVSITDFSDIDPKSLFATLITKESFVSQHCALILVGGKLKGILEIWFRRSFLPGSEWFVLFDAIANQTGMALDYNDLYADLQRTYLELETSYEATIEGWSAAMDLRDEETEGHSHRVTALSVSLAAKLGLGEKEIGYVRRGAFLHDIGKIGIPDSVLLKPGPLNEEEWVLMKQHSRKGYDLLARVPYLKESLDIPLHHHEKYNGTGYPDGLSGENIPLSARLFAIVDVFDALTSNMPYREAWSKTKAVAYLREQKGIHFDPNLVDVFISMIE